MQAGTCVGVTGVGDCVNVGWSPHYLAPVAWADQIDALTNSQADIVCPYCLVARADAARLPGWNKPKRDRIIAALDGFNCLQAERGTDGHCHLWDFESEDFALARTEPPGQGERGY